MLGSPSTTCFPLPPYPTISAKTRSASPSVISSQEIGANIIQDHCPILPSCTSSILPSALPPVVPPEVRFQKQSEITEGFDVKRQHKSRAEHCTFQHRFAQPPTYEGFTGVPNKSSVISDCCQIQASYSLLPSIPSSSFSSSLPPSFRLED